MKFKAYRKPIQFGFGAGGAAAEEYKRVVGHYHSGVDYSYGYGMPVRSDNYGIVYKIERPENSPSGWCGVYILCPDDKEGWVEVCFGHLSVVMVNVGDVVREDQIIGLEGNKGEVYYGGERITKAMQEAGDERGSHVHEQYRPVKRVRSTNKDKHYLNVGGKRYIDAQGYYYQVKYTNDTMGCVNPYLYVVEKNSLPVEAVNKLLAFFRK
jgi:murein DD-endopeptidase MepM/ murein hydrolase activator NlpD